jgi:squalene cyclase
MVGYLPILVGLALTSPGFAAIPDSGKDSVVVDERTETIINSALRYLSLKQNPNGSWANSEEELRHPVAITGYTLMAYLAAGQLPDEGEFSRNVAAGVQYLLDSTASDGIIGNREDGQYMYGHGVAATALAEVYGQSRSQTIRGKLERIIKVITSSQNEEGGWRYRPIVHDADISVTVLQVVALRAARNAGFNVPQSTIDAAVGYVRRCFHSASGGFTYQPNREPGFARTAAAIYSLQVCGLYDDEMVKRGSEYLLKYSREREQWFTYGNFYAAPAQYMIGGETWRRWYTQLKEVLLNNVTTREDRAWWEPRLDHGRAVGAVYCTAVYTMILAMPYHYIPLYQR